MTTSSVLYVVILAGSLALIPWTLSLRAKRRREGTARPYLDVCLYVGWATVAGALAGLSIPVLKPLGWALLVLQAALVIVALYHVREIFHGRRAS